MVNSAADWGPSDPLMVPHTVEELRARGASEKNIRRLVWDNPVAFFSQSGRLKL
jgi:predicted metal-dependent TIM-barrel fold hydrolase